MAMQVVLTGMLVNSKVSTFNDENNVPVEYGKIQVLVPDASGEFLALQNVKVKRDNFPLLADLHKQCFKQVSLDLSMNEYKGKVSYYLESVLMAKSA